MITTSKPSAPFIPTDKLEVLARELFNGALPKLPTDGMKRRSALAREFADAHLTVPGVAKRDAQKFAAIGTPFQAIAASRQARVDAFIAALPKPPTQADVTAKLVQILGERALKAKLLTARHGIAAALVLIDQLEGCDTALDLDTFAAAKLVDRLDTVFGQSARQQMLPRGASYTLDNLRLLDALADAVLDARDPVATSAPRTTTKPRQFSPTPTAPALSAAELGKLIRAESDPKKRAALFSQLQTVWKSNN